MPSIERRGRYQWAVLWGWVGVDEFNEPVLAAPVNIRVRWEEKTRQMTGPQGTPVTVDSTAVVEDDISVGSQMWLGQVADYLETGSAGNDTLHMEVVAFEKTPDLKGRNYLRTVGLRWFRDQPAAQG